MSKEAKIREKTLKEKVSRKMKSINWRRKERKTGEIRKEGVQRN